MSKVNLHTERVTAPTLFVTKGRQRVKQYSNNVVYLKNGDEFELELFNPTSNKVLAKISLNGSSLGSGIVLRPGERVFLERYFDEAKKFLFETYEVDGSNPNVKEAIKMNGVIDVEFFDEYKPCTITYIYPPVTWIYTWPWYTPSYPYPTWTPTSPTWTYTSGSYSYNNTTGISGNSVKSCSDPGVSNGHTAFYCSSDYIKSQKVADNKLEINTANAVMSFAPIETGRVEKGSTSNQYFTHDSTSFNSYYTWKTTWTILPDSQKVFAKEDLKVFCANCGAKRKKDAHKFCPNCGTKF
jgi:hypothetical protein